MTAVLRAVLVVWLAVAVAACGFQLRGSMDWPEALAPVQITGVNPRDSLYRELAVAFGSAGVEVVDQRPEGQGATLDVRSVRDRRRTLSVTDAARVAEYELIRSVEVRLRPVDGEAVDLGTLHASRIYLFDGSAVLSRSEREETLREAMNRDIVSQLQRRIQAVIGADGQLRTDVEFEDDQPMTGEPTD
ncbi:MULTISPECIES: LPS assembly lipoprotein LptE [unclassified Thioalkalivibrio]|uniref:LPS-assembly lipoprotein LptE n=1 Tax=unclassified Thioalkalivibrio TaxID=2621013 RepID=UPI000365102E|nr:MULTISPECIES: LPS assembly lipoprotein LptE [unclassified Thioalkalivibrio]